MLNSFFTDALNAMRKCCNIDYKEINMNCKLISTNELKKLIVKTTNPIFGPQPYLALKTIAGKYIWDNFDFNGINTWTYTFDHDSIVFDEIVNIGIAANNSYGMTEIYNYDKSGSTWRKTILNK